MIYYRANIFLREDMATTCPGCGFFETDDQSLFCNKCGYPFPRKQPNQTVALTTGSRQAPRTALRPVQKKAGVAGFFSFDTLITENSLKLIYIIGAVGIILVSLVGIAGMFSKPAEEEDEKTNTSFVDLPAIAEYPAGSALFWIGFLVAGSILWRMYCELFVMLSRIRSGHSHEEEATEYTSEPMEYGEEEAAGSGWEGSGQMVECP
ncbi:MAG: DUF4282 domain-containing protein, partial [Methanoregulaceae archaeon]